MVDPGEMELDPAQAGNRLGVGQGAMSVEDLDVRQEIDRQLFGLLGGMDLDLQSRGDRPKAVDEFLQGRAA